MTGQDCSCWGFDIGSNLAELLEQITTEVSGKYFIRVGMLNPAHLRKFYPQLIEAYEDEHIFKFVHIPVQSGSDEILQAMGRGYSTKDFKRIVSAFRTAFPQLQLWTDIIVGFPGETDVDFRRSLELIKEIKPDYVNVSKFGARMGTPAAKLEPLSGKVVAQRSRLISKIVDEMIVEQNQRWLGWSGSVLIDEFNQAKRSWIGRNFAYKPIILETENRLGTWVNVKIVRAEKNLIGVLE
jgi:MiaB/RimO family radical SAM methylthiotransferase